jgi:hypothetical protein
VNGLLFASVFVKKFTTTDRLDLVQAKPKTITVLKDKLFIHVVHMYSTNFLICAKSDNDRIIQKNRKRRVRQYYPTGGLNKTLVKLHPIPLYPYRMKVKIEEKKVFLEEDLKLAYFR